MNIAELRGRLDWMGKDNNLSVASTTPKWLRYFRSSVKSSDGFIQEMDRQLGKQFKDLTGFDLEAGFELRNHFPEPFQIVTTDRVSSVEGDLLGKKMGHYVEFSWKSASASNIQPNVEIGADEVQFWWSYLDAAGIIEEETRKPELYFDTGVLSFEIDNQILVWPHLSLELHFKERLPENALLKYEELLADAQTQWNGEQGQGIIHLIREVQVVNDHCLNVKIDFGSAGPAGLEFILKKLDESEPGIVKVRIGSY
jgi:hypothetical protein